MESSRSRQPKQVDPLDAEQAMALALKRLTARARSRAEIEQVLLQRGYEAGVVGSVVGRLLELGYLDDVRFAQAVSTRLLESGRVGAPEVERRLLRHGVAPVVVSRTLEDTLQAEGLDPVGAARRLLEGRGRGGGRTPTEQARDFRFLLGRGYAPDVARAAVGLDPSSDE